MKDFEIEILAPGEPVKLDAQRLMGELRPTKLWLLPKGSKDDLTSICWKLETVTGNYYVAQISTRMILDAFAEKGMDVPEFINILQDVDAKLKGSPDVTN